LAALDVKGFSECELHAELDLPPEVPSAPHRGSRRPSPRNAHHEGQQVKMLAVVRVVKPQVGMGIEFLDIDSSLHGNTGGLDRNFASRVETSVTSEGVRT